MELYEKYKQIKWDNQAYDCLLKLLISEADMKYREFTRKLVAQIRTEMIGIRLPKLRMIAKIISQGDYKEYLEVAKNRDRINYFEEIMLQGFVIGFIKNFDETLCETKQFVLLIDNWSVCDSFCASLKLTRKNEEKMFEFLQSYLASDREFELRFAIVMLLDFYINDSYIERVLDICNQTQSEYYYVNMAIAWAISVCYIKYPVQTFQRLNNHSLNEFTFRKAIQKIGESDRVSQEDKLKVKNLLS